MPLRDVFTEFFERNRWNDPESRSGTGSNLEQTTTIRNALPRLFAERGIQSIADIPCGDFHWMSKVDLSRVRYIGGDIVPDLIEQNRSKYRQGNIEFRICNLLEDRLPKVDLLLVRDCFVHFSVHDIVTAVTNILASDVEYLLATTFPGVEVNKDITTGEWREVDLQAHPFLFPPPIECIDEKSDQSFRARGKMLGLWRTKDLKNALPDKGWNLLTK